MLTRSRIDHAAIARDFAGRPDDWPLAPRFDPRQRWYHRLAATDEYEVWLLTWLPGQGTDLHDHGGSAGAFAVVVRQVTEYTLAPARTGPGAATPARHRRRPLVRPPSRPPVVNAGDRPAVTVHVYGPALTTMSRYRIEDGALMLAASIGPGGSGEPGAAGGRAARGIDEILAEARARLRRLDTARGPPRPAEGAVLVDIRPAAQRAAFGEIPDALIVERNVLEWRFDPRARPACRGERYDLPWSSSARRATRPRSPPPPCRTSVCPTRPMWTVAIWPGTPPACRSPTRRNRHDRRTAACPDRPRPGPSLPRPVSAEVRLSFEVVLGGDTRYTDALEVIDGVRLVTERVGAAALTVGSGRPAAAVPTAMAELPVDRTAIRIYPGMRSISLGAEPVELTKLEYDLMLFLAEHPRTVFTRLQLLQGVWGHLHAGVRTVDVHIRRLRAKLRDDLVITVRGVGYRLADNPRVRIVRTEGVGGADMA